MATAAYGRHLMAAIVLVAALFHQLAGCDAFSLPRNPLHRPSTPNIFKGSNMGGGGGKIPRLNLRHFDGGDDDGGGDIIAFNLASLAWISAPSDESNLDSSIDAHGEEVPTEEGTKESLMYSMSTETLRGGAGISAKESTLTKSSSDNKKSIGASVNDSLDSLQTMLFEPIRMAGSALSKNLPANPFQKSKKEFKMKQQQQLLTSTKVKSVSAPDSELLPPHVITQCAKESNLIGGTLTPETLEETSNMINRQYLEHGYVMNSVTGATLVPPSDGNANDGGGHVELKVREVKLARSSQDNSSPVHIRFVEKIADGADTGDDESIISLPSQSDQAQSDYQTYRTIPGRTRPSKIARMVNLVPGSHFCIFPERWSQLAAFPGSSMFGGGVKRGKSAIFSTIHAVRPVPTSQDGNTVELEIVASENKPYVSLEYGVTKSLFSDQWEGELDLNHANVFGVGEVATMNIRKGRSSGKKEDSRLKNWNKGVRGGPLNWRMSLKDDYLGGSDAGYDLEVFHDHVGVSGNRVSSQTIADVSNEETSAGDGSDKEDDTNGESCPLRTGASMRLRLPRTVPFANALSARFERVDPFAKNDCAQCMTSVSTDIGPYRHSWKVSSLPLLSTLSATATAGGRWNARSKTGESSSSDACTLPYATGTINSQQLLPLNDGSGSSSSIDLAMRHVVSASSQHLPRHEAILLGLSSRIRGYKYNYNQSSTAPQPQNTQTQQQKGMMQSLKQFVKGGNAEQFRPPIALSKTISGTLELRIPFERFALGSGNVVLFGDYCLAQPQPSLLSEAESNLHEKPCRLSSVGIGLRKVVQGLPLKMDACVTEHGSKGLFFGIGS
ncbi:hypothetical protein ACHAXR_008005 [Thalassiosira sp. AJA248-18]